MPIQTVVASLVLLHLRDEMNVIRRRICALQNIFKALEGSLILIRDDIDWVDSHLRPAEQYDQLSYTISRVEIDQRWSDWDDTKDMFDDTRDQIIEYEAYAQYIADSYNKLLTLVKENQRNITQSSEKIDDPRCICPWMKPNTVGPIYSHFECELKLY